MVNDLSKKRIIAMTIIDSKLLLFDRERKFEIEVMDYFDPSQPAKLEENHLMHPAIQIPLKREIKSWVGSFWIFINKYSIVFASPVKDAENLRHLNNLMEVLGANKNKIINVNYEVDKSQEFNFNKFISNRVT